MSTTAAAAAELVFIPFPIPGHLFSMLELAKQLVNHDHRLSATVFVIPLPSAQNNNLTPAVADDNSRLRLVHLPTVIPPANTDPSRILPAILEGSKPHVEKLVSDIVESAGHDHDSPRVVLAGFVVDMLCTTMIDVANEFGVPSYVFYPSSANFLGFMLHLQALYDEEKLGDLAELQKADSGSEMAIPTLKNPLPCKCLPSVVVEKEWLPLLVDNTRRIRGVKGIAVNTFLELESHALDSLATGGDALPPVYPVGPLLNLTSADDTEKKEYKEVMEWLDHQPAESVAFLCFGSMGSFVKEQVIEIARALENSGHRFLWSLRRPAETGITGVPSEYENLDDVLPEGFLDRMSGIGKVIGWAPQIAVLGHRSVGVFVSHCGWNSTLESLWFDVPIGAWPMYAEQQLNAFQLVEDLGLGEEIKMDYRWDSGRIMTAEEIEGGIRQLMAAKNDERKREKTKEMSEMSKKTSMEGGSSYASMTRFIQDVIDNIPCIYQIHRVA